MRSQPVEKITAASTFPPYFLGWGLVFVALFVLPQVLRSQEIQPLTLDSDYTAQRLVEEVFASGTCETISNIQSIGNPEGIGYFEGDAQILGFNRGIILSTGPIGNAVGPNELPNTSGNLGGPSPDPDLNQLAELALHDRVGIEFDFVPLQAEVSFRYVFASEEFCEFVGSDYNDVFGFFVSGPGINGPFSEDADNAALVPGTNMPVAINSVNHSTNSNYYLGNERAEDLVFCDLPTNQISPRIDQIEYDGQTVVLTATLNLIPCETYHLRLVISDVADENFDSAVFLEAGSFDLGGSVSLQALGSDTINHLIIEGCEQPSFRFLRGSDSDYSSDQTIAYRFGANSTAIPGIDFEIPSGSITIPAGEPYADLILNTIPDVIDEGQEDIWLFLDIPCACYTDSVKVSLIEPIPLVLNLDEAYYCPDQMATLNAEVNGGAPPYSYAWSTGNTEASPSLMPPLPATINLQVSDACGQVISGNIATFSSAVPTASFPPQDIAACWGEQRDIQVNLNGRPPFELTYQRSGNTPETISFDATGLQSWTIEQGGLYQLLSITDQACNGEVNGQVQANFYRPVINPVITHPNCANDRNGQIEVTHLPSLGPYQYEWSGDTDATGTLATNLGRGIYGLRITDALGCSDERTFELRGPTELLPVSVDCNQLRRPPLRLSADGGQAPYTYSIDGQDYWPAEGFDQLRPGDYYDLFIRDANGCELTQVDFFMPKAAARSVRLPNFIPQELGGSVMVSPEYLVPFDQVAELQWQPPDLFNCTNCREVQLSAQASQSISLLVTDRYGCVDSLSAWVGIDDRAPLFVPTAFSPNGDGQNDRVAVYANRAQVEQIVSFRIFTRWGSMVWEDGGFAPNSARRGWDGYFRGQLMPGGTYPWIAELLLTNGNTAYTSGSTHLVR